MSNIKVDSYTSIPSIMIHATIEHDRNNVETWVFDYKTSEHKLRLRRYEKLSRETPRHKFRAVLSWGNVDRRNLSERPPTPPEVLSAAREKFIETLKVE